MTIDDRPDAASGATAAATRTDPVGRPRASLRPLILRIHFWAGVIVGPFLFVAALTGAAYAVMPALEPTLYREQLTAPPGGPPLALSEQVRAGSAALDADGPGAELRSVRPAAAPGETTQVIATTPDLPESWYRTAFVDPATGDVRGVLDTYGSGQAMPARGWIDNLHRNLHLGEPGRLYAELAASWLWVLVLGGAVLWAGLVRRRRAAHRARALLVPRTRGGRRARLLSWHATVGLWAGLGLLFLSATGLTWSTYAGATISDVRSALSWTTPSVQTGLPGTDDAGAAAGHGVHTGHGGGSSPGSGSDVPGPDVTAFDVTARAAADVGVSGPVEITPGDPGEAWEVAQTDRELPQRLDAVAVDPASGTITDTVRFEDWPLVAKLARWGIDGHMGVLFGLPNQILLVALGLGLAAMVVWGWALWWRRGPGRAPGHVPPGGVLRSLPVGTQVAIWVSTAAVAYALPLLGVSLAAFLLAETLLDRRRTRGAPVDH